MSPRALILHAHGTNRHLDAARAFELAGALPEVVPLNDLRSGLKHWADYQLLCLPGGFSYADALGAGKLLALDLNVYFASEINAFVDSGRPVIGICNGFQALVKSGIFDPQPALGSTSPAVHSASRSTTTATLTFNQRGHFECRWVTLASHSQTCLWTRDLTDAIYCPVAHGEGNFTLADQSLISRLQTQDQIALIYCRSNGFQPVAAKGVYPDNPNGSSADIAGVCNPRGNVLGLMPHPENHIFPYQHPRWTRGERGGSGLALFKNGVRYASQS